MNKKVNIEKLEKLGKEIKLDLFKKFCKVRESHPDSVLSIFEITNTFYEGGFFNILPENNLNDTFIMRKGHAASVQNHIKVFKLR